MLVFIFSANADTYRQIKIFDTTQPTLEKLSGFDIINIKPGDYIELVADDSDFEKLNATGVPFEITIADLSAYYAGRYPVGTTMGGCHTYSETMAALDSLANSYPNLVSPRFSIGESHEGRGLWAIKISDNPNIDEDEPEILIDGLHHARECVTVEVCIEFARRLVQNYDILPEIRNLVDNNEFFILPIVNPDGYEYNRQTNPSGGGMWRKNRRNNGDGTYGVDLNRNYSYFWGYDNGGSSGYTSSETYRGPSPASEPEIQAMMNFITDHDFAWIMNFHSYADLVLWPWGYYDGVTEDDDMFHELFGNYGEDTLGYTVGTPWQTLYSTNGDANDWGYGEQRTKRKTFPMTIEIGGDYDGFWPPLDRIPVLVNENILALINFSHKAYEIYKRRNPPAPAIISPTVAPAGQNFYIHWQTADIDTFNLAQSYRVVEKSGYQRTTQTCESSSPFTNDNFSISTARYHGGTHSLYSGQGDEYRATAILKERLLVNPGDTLKFWTWYSIESNWDYAYVEVSSDGGYAWWPLDGNLSTTSNPNNHNEGYGITGASSGWVEAKYPLANYIGQQIDIRFRYWTDPSVVNEGIYIDDISPYDMFSTETVLTESTIPESLLVGPLNIGTCYFQVAARDGRSDMSPLSRRFAVEVTGETYTLSGNIELSDAPDNLSGSVVSIAGLGLSDSTDMGGNYVIPNVPSGTYSITASHYGYLDSTVADFAVNTDASLNFLLNLAPLTAPVLQSPANNATLDTFRVTFAWQDVVLADNYVFELASDNNFENIVVVDSVVSASSYPSPILYNGAYYWRVTAHNATQYSPQSEIRQLNIAVTLNTPALIAPANNYETDTAYVQFSWNPVPNALDYVLEIATDLAFADISEADSAIASNSFTNQMPFVSGEYYWRVTARGRTLYSNPSAARHITAVIPWNQQPPIPVSPGDGFISPGPYIQFVWQPVDGGDSYLYELATDQDFSALIALDSTLAGTSFQSDSLANGWYWWRVKAYNGQAWTIYSNPWSLMIDYDSTYVDFIPGDCNHDGNVIGSDVTFLVNFFRGIGQPPDPFLAGDTNGDCSVIGSDVTYLVNFFRGIGEPPQRGDCQAIINLNN